MRFCNNARALQPLNPHFPILFRKLMRNIIWQSCRVSAPPEAADIQIPVQTYLASLIDFP
jgi:hypothetical protein